MHVVILSAVIQGLAILHVLKTGRDFRWIFLLLFLPGIGVLIYFLIEVLPALNQNLTARRCLNTSAMAVSRLQVAWPTK
jgi:hypothetical protein